MVHDLKIWPKHFKFVKQGIKPFEVRKNDRGFHPGDILHLLEWDYVEKKYTGRFVDRQVTCVLHGGQYGIEEGYCVMGLRCQQP